MVLGCLFLAGVVVFGCRVWFITLGLGLTSMVSGVLACGGSVGFRFGVGIMWFWLLLSLGCVVWSG